MNFKQYFLLVEGGSGGHIAHPFDVDGVKTGSDLLNIFKKIESHLKKTSANLKIDGVNASVKITHKRGYPEFALDRGSSKQLDLDGITTDDLLDRFGAGHGFLTIGKMTLDSLNSCLPSIKPELIKLDLYDNPKILMNMEAVVVNESGKTNVVGYNNNFLVIHGLLEDQTEAGKKSRTITNISYDQKTMDSLVKKCNEKIKGHGFNKIYSIIPTNLLTGSDLNRALNEKMTIVFSKNKSMTKTLKEWLQNVKISDGTYVDRDGNKRNYVSQKSYIEVLNGAPLDEFVKEGAPKLVADGAITFHATRLLGQEILNNLDTELGPVNKHEGIVINAPSIAPHPIKITGDFLYTNIIQGAFRK